MKNKITTKKGDEGYTCLWNREIISKSSERIIALGKIDELIAILGICRSYMKDSFSNVYLNSIQIKLSKICAEVVDIKFDNKVNDYDIKYLEEDISLIENRIILPNHWIFCGNLKSASYLNFARTVARECERNVVNLLNKGELENERLIVYFNRLSDLFYLMCLDVEQNIKGEI